MTQSSSVSVWLTDWRQIMQALKKAAPYAGIFVFSILLFLLWGGFDPEMCIVDDNRTQWFPVMEHAYNDFFTSGRISVYDFFQFKGFSVAEQGYYSVMNPLMLLCYVLTHYTPIPLKALTLYTALLFSVGNICFYALCRELKCRLAEALLLTGGYCGISAFTAFFFWYYVYNNYFCIPLLILIFLRGRGKKWEYCGCGLLLAFEIMLGNVQYTFYHYMIFGILSFPIWKAILCAQGSSSTPTASDIFWWKRILEIPAFSYIRIPAGKYCGNRIPHWSMMRRRMILLKSQKRWRKTESPLPGELS